MYFFFFLGFISCNTRVEYSIFFECSEEDLSLSELKFIKQGITWDIHDLNLFPYHYSSIYSLIFYYLDVKEIDEELVLNLIPLTNSLQKEHKIPCLIRFYDDKLLSCDQIIKLRQKHVVIFPYFNPSTLSNSFFIDIKQTEISLIHMLFFMKNGNFAKDRVFPPVFFDPCLFFHQTLTVFFVKKKYKH